MGNQMRALDGAIYGTIFAWSRGTRALLLLNYLDFFSSILLIRNHMIFRVQFGVGVGAVVRSLPSNTKVPGSIPGSAENGIFGDLLSR